MGYFAIRCKTDNENIGLYKMQIMKTVQTFIDMHNHNKTDVIENLEIVWMQMIEMSITILRNVCYRDTAIELIATSFYLKQYDEAVKEIYQEVIPELDIHTFREDEIASIIAGRNITRSQTFHVGMASPDTDRKYLESETDYIFRLKSDDGDIVFLKRVIEKNGNR